MVELFAQYQPMITVVVAIVVSMNILLGAIKLILEKIKDLTKTDADNKAYDVVSKFAGLLSKLADWVSANIEHKK